MRCLLRVRIGIAQAASLGASAFCDCIKICPLSQGAAGQVHGGDRLPWVSIDGSDNFVSLADMTWQVHVYGAAGRGIADWCSKRKVPLRQFDWREDFAKAGIERNALYLLRPDSYVALAATNGKAAELDRYFQEHAILPGAFAE